MELFQRYISLTKRNTLQLTIPGNQMYFTVEPENIKAILATQFDDFAKGKPFHDSWKDVVSSDRLIN